MGKGGGVMVTGSTMTVKEAVRVCPSVSFTDTATGYEPMDSKVALVNTPLAFMAKFVVSLTQNWSMGEESVALISYLRGCPN